MSAIQDSEKSAGEDAGKDQRIRVSKQKKYSVDDLKIAMTEISNGKSLYAVSKQYEIPETTLRDHRDGKLKGNRKGKLMFSPEMEKELSDWIIKCAARGGPRTKGQLLEAAHQIRKQVSGDENVAAPSKDWCKSFMQRNETLSYQIAQPVTRNSACVSEADIRRWFKRIHEYLVKEDLLHLLSDSSRWINCDVTGYELNPKPGRVIAIKGASVVNYVETAHPSERVSVMYTFGADGHAYSPQIILKNSVSANKIHDMISTSVGKLKLF